MIGLGLKNYNGPSVGRKFYGSSRNVGNKFYGSSSIKNKPHIVNDPETLYRNEHNSNIQYVPFGTTKNHLYDDKLNLHSDPVKKHDGNLTRTKFQDKEPEYPAAVKRNKLFK